MVEDEEIQHSVVLHRHDAGGGDIDHGEAANEEVVIQGAIFHLIVAKAIDAVYLQWRDPTVS